MPRPGLAFLHARAQDAIADAPCGGCDHTIGEHHELPPSFYTIEGDRAVIVTNPAYRPLHFHCSRPGCACVIGADRASVHSEAVA